MTKLLLFWFLSTKQYEGTNTLYQFQTWISLIFFAKSSLFHPFHNKKLKIIALASTIALTILTGFMWQIPFWIVNRLDQRQVNEWKSQTDHEIPRQVQEVFRTPETVGQRVQPSPIKQKNSTLKIVKLDASLKAPTIRDSNKRYVYDQVMKGRQVDDQLTVTYHDYPAQEIRKVRVFGEIPLHIEQNSGKFPFPDSDEEHEHWTADFADNDLLGFCKGGLLAQEELLCVEHPSLVHLKEELEKSDETRYLSRPNSPDRIALIRGAKRRAVFNMYGNGFASASQEEINRHLQVIPDPQASNIFAFAVPVGAPNTPYSRSDFETAFIRAYNAFRAMKEGGDERNKTVVVHTGNWGCGAFGGNPVIMNLLQMLAASAAGVEHLNFYPMSARQEMKEANRIFDEVQRVKPRATVEEVISYLEKNYEFKWGVSNGT